MWTNADTVETAAAAAGLLVALGTGALAWKTHNLAGETRKMADETRRIAEATEVQAATGKDLIREAQMDRELAWSPFLVVAEIVTATSSADSYSQSIRVSNVGRGQALDCVYVARLPSDVSKWCYWRGMGLGGGQSTEEVPAGPGKTYPLEVFDWSPGDAGPAFHAVLLCRDVFGNYLRFPVGRDFRDRWREGDLPVPNWVSNLRAWGVARS